MIFVVGFALHYCGIGLFHVWNERSLHFVAWKEAKRDPTEPKMCSDLDGKGKLSGGPKEVPQNPALAYAFEARFA